MSSWNLERTFMQLNYLEASVKGKHTVTEFPIDDTTFKKCVLTYLLFMLSIHNFLKSFLIRQTLKGVSLILERKIFTFDFNSNINTIPPFSALQSLC